MGQLAAQPGVDIHVGGSFSGQIAIGDNILQIGSVSGGVVNILSPERRPVPKPRPTPVNARPRAFRELLGREEEVGKALTALRTAVPVEVYALSGLGKTSLLRHLAHHQLSESFTDGVVYARVERKTVEDSSQEIFQAFFECDVPYKPTDVEIRLHLGDKNALILLDDVEWGREDVERLLNAAPGCLFVLGSPERHLWDEGCPIALGGLPIDAAFTLIEQRLGRAITPKERPLAKALCKATGGHPLRLVQAIGLVQDGSKTLSELAGELLSESPAPSLAKRAVASRSESERRALAVLAALGGLSATTEHLGSLAALQNPHDVVGSLRERGLVLIEGARCRLAGMLASPLAKKWDLTLSSKRALGFYAAWADRRNATKDYGRIMEEAEILLHSLTWAVQAQRWRQVLQLGRAMEDALALSGRWGAWRQVLDAQLQAASALGDRAAEARALHQLGTRDLCLGQVAPARTFLTSALSMREALGDEVGAEITRHNLSLLPQLAPLNSHDPSKPGHGGGHARWWTTPLVCLLLVFCSARIGPDTWPAAQLQSIAVKPHQLAAGARAQGVVSLTRAAPTRGKSAPAGDGRKTSSPEQQGTNPGAEAGSGTAAPGADPGIDPGPNDNQVGDAGNDPGAKDNPGGDPVDNPGNDPGQSGSPSTSQGGRDSQPPGTPGLTVPTGSGTPGGRAGSVTGPGPGPPIAIPIPIPVPTPLPPGGQNTGGGTGTSGNAGGSTDTGGTTRGGTGTGGNAGGSTGTGGTKGGGTDTGGTKAGGTGTGGAGTSAVGVVDTRGGGSTGLTKNSGPTSNDWGFPNGGAKIDPTSGPPKRSPGTGTLKGGGDTSSAGWGTGVTQGGRNARAAGAAVRAPEAPQARPDKKGPRAADGTGLGRQGSLAIPAAGGSMVPGIGPPPSRHGYGGMGPSQHGYGGMGPGRPGSGGGSMPSRPGYGGGSMPSRRRR